MNPPYRILLYLAKSCTLVQFDNKNAFHRAVLNFIGLKLKLRGVSTSCIVVMVTYILCYEGGCNLLNNDWVFA